MILASFQAYQRWQSTLLVIKGADHISKHRTDKASPEEFDDWVRWRVSVAASASCVTPPTEAHQLALQMFSQNVLLGQNFESHARQALLQHQMKDSFRWLFTGMQPCCASKRGDMKSGNNTGARRACPTLHYVMYVLWHAQQMALCVLSQAMHIISCLEKGERNMCKSLSAPLATCWHTCHMPLPSFQLLSHMDIAEVTGRPAENKPTRWAQPTRSTQSAPAQEKTSTIVRPGEPIQAGFANVSSWALHRLPS